MRKSKYIMSGGLAFFEESDMEKLRKKSMQGWHIKKFSFFGYRLERGAPTDFIYTIDYYLLKEEEQEEYFDLFQVAGWEHVCTEHNMHIFRAPKGTKPIYSDSNTKEEKYNRLLKSWRNGSIVLLSLFIIFLILTSNTMGMLRKIGSIGLTLSSVLLVPCIMTYIAIFRRRYKMKLKKEV